MRVDRERRGKRVWWVEEKGEEGGGRDDFFW